MEIYTGGLGASRGRGPDKGFTNFTQYDKRHGVFSKLMMEHEGLHRTQISTTLALEDLGKQLHESQRQHHRDIQDMQEVHSRELVEMRTQQELLVRTEISTAFQQMSFRAEFTQRLLHFESALSDVYNRYNTAKNAHQQALNDLGQLDATKHK